jgi:adenylate cyclase
LKLSVPPRRRLVFLSGLVPVIFGAVLAIYRPPLFTRLDAAAYDALLRSTTPRGPAGRIVIVDIDERSLASVGQWPWRRDVVGHLITSLRDAGASAIALDVIFAETDRRGGSTETDRPESTAAPTDRALADVVRDSGAVLGYGLTFDPGGPSGTGCVHHPLPLAIVQAPGEQDAEPYFNAAGAVCNLPLLAEAATRSGFLNAVPDTDGILRRAPVIANLQGRIYPSLALAVYAAVADASRPSLRVSTVDSSTLSVGDLDVPLDGKGNLLLRFRGKKRTFPYVSAVDVLNGAARDALRGQIVLVGTTALGTREVVATPLDTQFVGVEVQATAIDNLLQRDFARRSATAPFVDALTTVLAPVAVVALVAASGVTAGLAGAGVLIAALWWGVAWLLGAYGVVLSPLAPTAAMLVTLAVVTLARFTVERGRAARASHEKTAAQRLMVQALLSLTEVRDAETGRHSLRTQQYARLLAEALSTHPRFRGYLTRERIELLSQLAPLHDIGKVGIPDRVLNKPGRLTPDELAEMRRHPELGREVIIRAESRVGVRDEATLQMAKDIVYTHHEKWDGTGYPRGLRGTDIPVEGRIMAVVDVYDAVHARSLYTQALPHDETVNLIVKGRETHFDPDVVDAFLQVSTAFEDVSKVGLEPNISA